MSDQSSWIPVHKPPADSLIVRTFVVLDARTGDVALTNYFAHADGSKWVILSRWDEEHGKITHWLPIPPLP